MNTCLKSTWSRIFLTVCLLNYGFILSAPKHSRERVFSSDNNNEILFSEVIENIKKNESFQDSIYLCPGGYKTIGYGHLITELDTFVYLSKKDAETVLKKDFQKAFNCTPENITYKKRLALSHFIFNMGIGRYNRKVKPLIESGSSIDSVLLEFCYIKGRKNMNLLRLRNYELKLWKSK